MKSASRALINAQNAASKQPVLLALLDKINGVHAAIEVLKSISGLIQEVGSSTIRASMCKVS